MSDASKIVKLILLGDPECGKTSLLLRYCKDSFSAESEVTIDESFERKLANTNDGEREVQVWDTAGEERFRNLTSSTYRGAHGILLVYDVSNKESFDNLVNWIGDIKIQRGTVGDEVPTVIVANKIDKADERKISLADGEAFAATHKLPHIQTSALTGENVGDAFRTLIDIIIPPPVVAATTAPPTSTSTTTTTRPPTESKGCCRIV